MAEYNTKELLSDLEAVTGHDSDTVKEIFDGLCTLLADKLATETRLELKSLGVLKLVKRAARTGKTVLGGGKDWSLPERYVVDFTPSKVFLDQANKSKTFTENIVK
jgi:nucleoid DNA-binding protein